MTPAIPGIMGWFAWIPFMQCYHAWSVLTTAWMEGLKLMGLRSIFPGTGYIEKDWGSSFPGYIVGLWYRGELYRFAIYNGTRVEQLEMTASMIYWTLASRTHRLELAADRAGSGLLYAPGDAGMACRVAESLAAMMDVRLTTLQGKVLFEDEGSYAGLEVVGDVRRLGAKVQE